MALRDQVLDDALAGAKQHSHAAVEPRHVLWAIVHVLGPNAPEDLTAANVRRFLEPSGSAVESPTVSPEATAILAAITDDDSAIAQARSILASLAGAEAAGPPTTATAATATASTPAPSTTASAAPTPLVPGKEPLELILAELDALIGMRSVKAEVHRLVAVEKLNAARRAAGLPEIDATNHLVFTGPPGTGKTTVARIIGRLYGNLGVVTKGHLVEATRADLVAGYVGQTALKVTEVVNRAVGGVLFIDEAYALSSGDLEDFGGEAVATLVKLMEDHRDNLAVIVAGYRDQIWDFIHTNPGLRSRFTRYIDFPDFTPDELTRVFVLMAAAAKVQAGNDVVARVRQVLDEEREVPDFGNARFVRTLFERAYANMADRVTADDRIDAEELGTMIVADLPGADVPPGGHSRHIGFRPIGAGAPERGDDAEGGTT